MNGSREFEHTLYGFNGTPADVGIDRDFRFFVAQAYIEFLDGVQAHEITFVAGARTVVRRRGDKAFLRILPLHFVDDSAFGYYDKLRFRRLSRIGKQRCRRTDIVGHHQYRLLTFGVSDHFRSGIFLLQCQNLFRRKLFVDVAGAIPKQHPASRHAVYVIAEIAVGAKNQRRVLRECIYNLAGIR